MSDDLAEIEWRYDRGQDLFQQDYQFLFKQADRALELERLWNLAQNDKTKQTDFIAKCKEYFD